MKTLSLIKNSLIVLATLLSACSPQTTPAVVTVVVTATPGVQSTQPLPVATNTPVVQNTNPQPPGGQNQQPPPRPSGAPPAAAQPTLTSSTVQQAVTIECPTKNFIDVSTYKPKSGWPSPKLKVTCEGGFMIIETNGVPNFDTRLKQNDQTFKMKVPLSPQKANRATEYQGGTIALAVNGVQFWAPLESPQDGLADPILEGLMELCNGHALPFHFHGRPDCLFANVINQTSLVMGYALDGFPIMAPYICEDAACTKIKKVKSSWQVANANVRNVWERYKYVEGSGDLDKCNGLTGMDGKYRYYATDTFPYTLACYSGTPGTIDGNPMSGAQSAGGQQPGGGGQQPSGTRLSGPPPGGSPPPPRP